MKFQNLELNPAKNPAVLDTVTWDRAAVWKAISAVDESYWESVRTAACRVGFSPPENGGGARSCRRRPALESRADPVPSLSRGCPRHDGGATRSASLRAGPALRAIYSGSAAKYQRREYFLVGFDDGQHVFIELGAGDKSSVLGDPIGTRELKDGCCLSVYPTDSAVVDLYVSLIRPDKGPKVLGVVPRLGIGSRMTTAAWPGVWRAMSKCNFRANPIQNSIREVNLLEDVLAAQPQRLNYMANFGRVPEGHAGSTFEGLWVAGVLESLKADSSPEFGADADHITVRRGDETLDRARRVIEAARRYTFFTLDVSDLLDYDAKAGRPAGKYWSALDAIEQLAEHINSVKDGKPFDLELSIDETPAGIDTFDCLTSEDELTFLINEIQRRGLPVTHIAPNFGIEKELDYRGHDGLGGLEKRIRKLQNISREFGIMLDCHSGDDLKPATRRTVGRATQGHVHFKISPALQIIFTETMNDVVPERFGFWWDDTLDHARREAEAGSAFAAKCLHEYETGENRHPSPDHAVFHYYNFASVGKRDDRGRFVHREKFYDLPADFYDEYRNRICSYLCEVAADVEIS